MSDKKESTFKHICYVGTLPRPRDNRLAVKICETAFGDVARRSVFVSKEYKAKDSDRWLSAKGILIYEDEIIKMVELLKQAPAKLNHEAVSDDQEPDF